MRQAYCYTYRTCGGDLENLFWPSKSEKKMMTTLATPELSLAICSHAVAEAHYTIHMNVLSYTHMLSETLAIGNSIVSGPTVISSFVGLLQMQLMFKDTTLLVLVGSFIVDTVQDMMRRYLRITPIQ